MKFIKRLLHPQDWLLEKDIRDLEIEIEMLEKQLPAYRRKLDALRRKKADYQD